MADLPRRKEAGPGTLAGTQLQDEVTEAPLHLPGSDAQLAALSVGNHEGAALAEQVDALAEGDLRFRGTHAGGTHGHIHAVQAEGSPQLLLQGREGQSGDEAG